MPNIPVYGEYRVKMRDAPDVQQRIDTNASMFGGNQANALKGWGEAFGKMSDTFGSFADAEKKKEEEERAKAATQLQSGTNGQKAPDGGGEAAPKAPNPPPAVDTSRGSTSFQAAQLRQSGASNEAAEGSAPAGNVSGPIPMPNGGYRGLSTPRTAKAIASPPVAAPELPAPVAQPPRPAAVSGDDDDDAAFHGPFLKTVWEKPADQQTFERQMTDFQDALRRRMAKQGASKEEFDAAARKGWSRMSETHVRAIAANNAQEARRWFSGLRANGYLDDATAQKLEPELVSAGVRDHMLGRVGTAAGGSLIFGERLQKVVDEAMAEVPDTLDKDTHDLLHQYIRAHAVDAAGRWNNLVVQALEHGQFEDVMPDYRAGALRHQVDQANQALQEQAQAAARRYGLAVQPSIAAPADAATEPAGIPIPEDAKKNWDFRGGSPAAKEPAPKPTPEEIQAALLNYGLKPSDAKAQAEAEQALAAYAELERNEPDAARELKAGIPALFASAEQYRQPKPETVDEGESALEGLARQTGSGEIEKAGFESSEADRPSPPIADSEGSRQAPAAARDQPSFARKAAAKADEVLRGVLGPAHKPIQNLVGIFSPGADIRDLVEGSGEITRGVRERDWQRAATGAAGMAGSLAGIFTPGTYSEAKVATKAGLEAAEAAVEGIRHHHTPEGPRGGHTGPAGGAAEGAAPTPGVKPIIEAGEPFDMAVKDRNAIVRDPDGTLTTFSAKRKDAIRELAEGLGSNSGEPGRVWYGLVPEKNADRVNDAVRPLMTGEGADFRNIPRSIDSTEMTHALNRHRTDQLPLQKSDFERVPEVVESGEIVGAEIKRGTLGITYRKLIDGNWLYVVEEVRGGAGAKRITLNFKTAYWNPGPRK